MRRIHAYVLAADPTWVRQSVSAYYREVERLVVAYDRSGKDWLGGDIDASEALDALRALDVDGKIEWFAGDFGGAAGDNPMDGETRARRAALERAEVGADWVLQIDTDEVLPDWAALNDALALAEDREIPSVEWPMRVLFRRLWSGAYLEVATLSGSVHFEYPGPIAVRPGARLIEGRRAEGPYVRPVVSGDCHSLQLRQPPESGEVRATEILASQAIWHNSWARTPKVVRAKIMSWSHSAGSRTWIYYWLKWWPAPLLWRAMRCVHPFDRVRRSRARALWPRLQISQDIPASLK